MEPLRLRQPVESPEVEEWGDDDFDNFDDIQFRAASTATSVASHPQANHRESLSSRLSIRSDSNQGDENWDVLVDESASVKDAIAIAKSKGIPIPATVPRSALEGGTIRRLNGKAIKKAIADDWSEDLDLPNTDSPLKLAKAGQVDYSDTLRQISTAFGKSPVKLPSIGNVLDQTVRSPKARSPALITLEQFQDKDDDDTFGDVPTIKIAKHRSLQKPTLFQPPAPKAQPEMESIEEGLELPSNGQLKLSTRKQVPRTPQQNDEFDMEWAEGSLGTRHGGTRRDGRSNRSSSASALSPSVSSAFTAESEDEGLDGLVLPEGPLKFEEALKRRQESHKSDHQNHSGERNTAKQPAVKDEFFDGLEIGDGEVFDAGKLTLNRNIKHKIQRAPSPPKRSTTTLNFTSTKSQTTISRLPRFQQSAHDRHVRNRSNLEPVSESGVAVSRYQRPESRQGHHSANSSLSSIAAVSSPSTPSTPSRRGLRGTDSRSDMRYEPPTTTNAQLLKAKRSMPVMRNLVSPTKPTTYPRPQSRQDGSEIRSRLNLPARPRTPTERAESRIGDIRKSHVPFLPAGVSTTQSQHISLKSKSSRNFKRNDSEGSNEGGSVAQRTLSRAGFRPETPRVRGSLTSAELAAAAKKTITKPTRRRNFGDGTELEIFDDLPTSASVESKFTKQPVGRGAPRILRSKLGQSHIAPSTTSVASARPGTETPMPVTPLSPIRQEFNINSNVPRFARDTAASRNREQRQVSSTTHHHHASISAYQNIRGEPLQPLTTNQPWKSSNVSHVLPSRTNIPSPSVRHKKPKSQQKPHLIKPLGNEINRAREQQGMSYNPVLFRWEGNENALAPFDVPDFTPRDSSPGAAVDGSPGSKGAPALITNIGQVGGVQVVGGMVFDPRRMCWLKMAGDGNVAKGLRGGSSVQLEEEEDVFAGLEDLKEEDEFSVTSRSRTSVHASTAPHTPAQPQPQLSRGDRNISAAADREDDSTAAGHSSGDEMFWGGIGEEFDVGPEFIKRQHAEEEKWKRKLERWLRPQESWGPGDGDGRDGWRWAIRDVVLGDGGAQ